MEMSPGFHDKFERVRGDTIEELKVLTEEAYRTCDNEELTDTEVAARLSFLWGCAEASIHKIDNDVSCPRCGNTKVIPSESIYKDTDPVVVCPDCRHQWREGG